MQVLLDDQKLVIKLRGWEIFWCLYNKLEIPRGSIVEVNCYEPTEKMQFRRDLLKIAPVSKRVSPGVSITPWSKDFWFVRPNKRYVEIITRNYEFGRIVISPPPGDVDLLDHEFNKLYHSSRSGVLSAELGTLKNLGPKYTRWLRDIGIKTQKDLQNSNLKDIYIKLKAVGHPVSKQLLCSIEGARTDQDWHLISNTRKREISQIILQAEQETEGQTASELL